MKNVALQMYSIRELMKADSHQAILDVAKAGYSGIEFAGFFDHPVSDIKAWLDEAGIVCAGTHTGLALLQPDTIAQTIEDHHTLGTDLLVLPGVPGEMYGSYDAACEMGAMLDKIGAQLKREGICFYYHNHYREFDIFNGKRAFDLIFEHSSPENLSIELDCYWASIGGVEPYDYIKKYGSRCSLLHVKDRKPGDEEKVKNHIFECTEVGYGVIDYKKIIALGNQVGVKWYTVEQESFDMPMLESIAKSAKWLNENV
ncbi:MAG: sugar phosphate isomerase/epimerase [Clostridiales bacterium]|jgi:sugar phosphate isomerase/epimerase|nr:sugar phosphate isomerase/epimerase [Clostridiales bacterium]